MKKYNSVYDLKLRDFWGKQFTNYNSLPHLFQLRQPDFEGETGNISMVIPAETSARLVLVANHSDLSRYILFLSTVFIWLYKYCNRTDIILRVSVFDQTGKIRSGRKLFLRVKLDPNWSSHKLINVVKDQYLLILDHQEMPEYEIEQILKQTTNQDNTFEILLCNARRDVNDLKVNQQLSFDFIDDAENQVLRIEFNKGIYDEQYLTIMALEFIDLFSCILFNPDQLIKDVYSLSTIGIKTLLEQFNKEIVDSEAFDKIHVHFYNQMRKTPNAIALSYYDQQISYEILWAHANVIAGKMHEVDSDGQQIVIVSMEQSPQLIAVLLAIMINGAIYLPVDPLYPDERIKYIIKDSNAKVAITSCATSAARLKSFAHDLNVYDVRSIMPTKTARVLSMPLNPYEFEKSTIAYINYTSGTTGAPKAAIVTHRGITNTVLQRKSIYQLSEGEIYLQLFSFSFDGFVTSTFTPLISGGKLVLMKDKSRKDTSHIAHVIQYALVGHLISVPLLFENILDKMLAEDRNYLHTVVLAGDKMNERIFDKISKKRLNLEIANEYGVTEVSVLTSLKRNINADNFQSVGTPISNNKVIIIDQKKRILPIGWIGELAVGGVGVGKGYLNDPERTDDKFFKCPSVPDQEFYRTGDLAKWLPSGEIELLGRIDDQVNLNGFRIELKEIEDAICLDPNVKQAIVNPILLDSTKFLCAYVILYETVSDLKKILSERLSAFLPIYMIPSFYVELDKIPVSENGKLDRLALPNPTVSSSPVCYNSEPFYDKILRQGLDQTLQIGTKKTASENFFENGGHSLTAISLAMWINKRLSISLDIADIFDYPNFKDLSKRIAFLHSRGGLKIKKTESKEFYELTPSQLDVFVADKLASNKTTFNMPFAARIRGGIDFDKINCIIKSIIQRHDSLRASFCINDQGRPVQVVKKDVTFSAGQFQISRTDLNDFIQNLIVPFDVAVAPLLHVCLVLLDEIESILFIDFHHLISDGTSTEIFFSELVSLYNEQELVPLEFNFCDYIDLQRHIRLSGSLIDQQNFWLDYLGSDELSAVTFDMRKTVNRYTYQGSCFKFTLGKDITTKLMACCEKEQSTIYSFIFPIFNILLSKLTNRNKFIIGTPITARNRVGEIIGMLVNILPLKSKIDPSDSFKKYSGEFKESLIECFRNQDFTLADITGELRKRALIQKEEQLVKIIFSFDNNVQKLETSRKAISGMLIEPFELQLTSAPYELYLIGVLLGDDIAFTFEYSTTVFGHSEIHEMSKMLTFLIEEFINDKDKIINEVKLSKGILPNQNNYTESDYF